MCGIYLSDSHILFYSFTFYVFNMPSSCCPKAYPLNILFYTEGMVYPNRAAEVNC